MTPKQSRAQLSKSADWVTNMSMQSTYTPNVSKFYENFDISTKKVDKIDIYSEPVDILVKISTYRQKGSMESTYPTNMSIFFIFIDIFGFCVDWAYLSENHTGSFQVTVFEPSLPYNELPELPPPVDQMESTPILKRCIDARVALAELKQAAELIPNSAVLVNALPLLEAQASSEIENIVTTTDKLFEFADIAEDRADAATKEALRYRTALYEGTKMVQRGMLTTDMAIQICSTVKGYRAGYSSRIWNNAQKPHDR